jgi:hypothetical protein
MRDLIAKTCGQIGELLRSFEQLFSLKAQQQAHMKHLEMRECGECGACRMQQPEWIFFVGSRWKPTRRYRMACRV